MSDQNVTIVRAIHEALARGESPAGLGLLHPDVEYVNPPGAVEPGTRRGIAAYEGALSSIYEALEDVHIETREIVDAGDQVVVLATFTDLAAHLALRLVAEADAALVRDGALASAGLAIRSRRPLVVGRARPRVGLTSTSERASARR